MILYDNGWSHTKGIQRFSSGVLGNLHLSWKMLFADAEVSRVRKYSDIHQYFARKQNRVFYSPGYIDYPYALNRIITIHDMIQLDSYTRFKKLRAVSYYNHYLRPRILSGEIQICTVSNMSRERIQQWLGTSETNIVVASPGLSSPFTDIPNLETKSNQQIILVTSPASHKGFDIFAKATWHLRGRWKIVIVGIFNLEKYDLDPRHNYKIYNSVSDEQLLQFYRSSTMLCVPSTMEGFCIPALEAASQGLQVVFFDHIKTIHEIAGKLGISVDLASGAEGLAAGIDKESSLTREETIIEMYRIRDEYSWKKTLLSLEELLRSTQKI